ncbi:HD-GYP domain-containing protein [Rubripirellula reticaptiva]|uniref:Cyclic di-GMP phosphodiesterase response regulator RpfG n=1 Tax=Rubripirellula reticaptiva TaxID=2528013 RepID=A0A5C6EIX5_9BACT|nr:HD domain-containing phosphohydrolase [Rubripirellula reticaptiva]TWU48405.1 Cyclic di-GMP phosphodiesterase response regulator RpfG [Rubripirellula reticaptiva]
MKCKKVPLSTLKAGAILSAPVIDPIDSRVKLLAQGTRITNDFLQRLESRRITSVVLSVRDIAILMAFTPQGRRTKVPPPPVYVTSRSANDYSDAMDNHVLESGPLELTTEDRPLSSEFTKPADCAYADGLTIQWANESDARINNVNTFLADTATDQSTDIGALRVTCFDLLDMIMEDQDALVCWACAPYESDYPSRHGLHVAALALAIGTEMGLGRTDLMELGIGCLMHDSGMQAVGLNMFDTNQPLVPGQLNRLADHPVRAIEIAGGYGEEISSQARFVIYQLHERGDGSGYPRGLTAEAIHPLAKIAAVADAFIGMLTNRKHRLAILGYHAVVNLLDEMKAGKFDAAVLRAMLKVTSLYPIGSRVTLTGHKIGRVIRSGGADFLLPTIEMWDENFPDRKPDIVNLRREPAYQITGSIPARAA